VCFYSVGEKQDYHSVDHNKALVVSPSDVVSLAAYRFLPSDTFGIKKDGTMLPPDEWISLHGRKKKYTLKWVHNLMWIEWESSYLPRLGNLSVDTLGPDIPCFPLIRKHIKKPSMDSSQYYHELNETMQQLVTDSMDPANMSAQQLQCHGRKLCLRYLQAIHQLCQMMCEIRNTHRMRDRQLPHVHGIGSSECNGGQLIRLSSRPCSSYCRSWPHFIYPSSWIGALTFILYITNVSPPCGSIPRDFPAIKQALSRAIQQNIYLSISTQDTQPMKAQHLSNKMQTCFSKFDFHAKEIQTPLISTRNNPSLSPNQILGYSNESINCLVGLLQRTLNPCLYFHLSLLLCFDPLSSASVSPSKLVHSFCIYKL
ncbi:hypothetical protein VP01_5502g2, partial [Puccinia sorghi]